MQPILSAANTGGLATQVGKYDPASFKNAPAGSYEAQLYASTPAASTALPVTQPGGAATTSPVVTSSAATSDLAAKQTAFNNIQAQNAAQAQNVAQKQQYNKEQQAILDNNNKLQAQVQAENARKQQETDAKTLALTGQTPTTNTSTQTGNTQTTGNTGTNTGTTGTTGGTTGTTTPADTTQSNLDQATNTYTSSLNDLQQAETDLITSTKSQLDSVMNGTFPLTASQQGLINSVNAQLAQNVASQTVANNAYTGAVTEAGFREGGEYTPQQYAGQIANAVSYGVAKIQELDGKAAATIADLQDKFQTQNYDLINKGYDLLQKQLDSKGAALKDMYDTVTSNLKDARDQQQKVQDKVSAIALEAAKNGATAEIQAKINASKDEGAAITAAGDYIQSATGTLGDYLQYKREAEANGLTPTDYQTYKDQQDAKTAKLKAQEAYSTAYNSAAGKAAAEAKAGGGAGYNGTTQKQQIALEQQYRQILGKEFSARTGALGVENAKVNQANHLDSLFKNYYDPKTGNYNIPTSQYAEVVSGLANLISPTGTGSDQQMRDLNAMTAKGDLNGAIQYLTGEPQNGNTQAIIKNLIDTVDRQAATAESNRQAALDNMKNLAPTDLDPARADALNKATNMVSYTGQDRLSKGVVDKYLQSNGNQMVDTPDGKHSMYYVVSQLYQVPGATNQDVEEYLKANGAMQ